MKGLQTKGSLRINPKNVHNMKRTILLFIVITICLNLPSVVGQEMIIKEQLYTANLEAYTGTWEYNNGSDVFRISLKKVEWSISN